MGIFVALLRGINVGGTGLVPQGPFFDPAAFRFLSKEMEKPQRHLTDVAAQGLPSDLPKRV
jgi:hypothetical protein